MVYRTFLHCENGKRIPAVFAEKSIDEIVSRELEHRFTFVNESKVEFDSKVRCIEFLNANPIPWKNVKITIRRIFSLSDAFMARYQLCYKYRVEFVIHYPNGSHIKSGCAYIPGMFDPQ